TIDLDDIDATEGFRVDGVDETDRLGDAVSNAGDINGDGIDDFILGALAAGPNGFFSGEAFVVFGRADGFPPALSAADLDGTNGFRISGEASSDILGGAVSAAGDLNGDGIDDIIIAAPGAGAGDRGEAYVIFGSRDGFAAEISPDDLDGANGLTISGLGDRDRLGTSFSEAGDANGEGFDDLIVGIGAADANGRNNAGEAFVVFGADEGFGARLDAGRD
ncbi:MAG: integrin alpha, partial [Pseudomonadota bacterium]